MSPKYRDPETQNAGENAEGGITPKDSKSETQTDGSTTPVAGTNGVERDVSTHVGSALEVDSATPAIVAAQTLQNTPSADIKLPEIWLQFLNPTEERPFMPWPSEEYIRKGALASIQILLDQGVDPSTFDPEKSTELEAERRRVMEEEDRAREQERARSEEDRRRETERRLSVSGNLPGERMTEKPKVFQLETFDDDDDEDGDL